LVDGVLGHEVQTEWDISSLVKRLIAADILQDDLIAFCREVRT
jgi:hypothetical protein